MRDRDELQPPDELPSADPAAREQVIAHFAQWLGEAPSSGETEPGRAPPRAVQELLDVLRRRALPSGSRAGRRHRRHVWRARLTLLIQEHPPDVPARRALTVTTCDLSRGGFSFMTAEYIARGTTIFARFENLPHRPCLRTIVCHCSRLAPRLHRIGVEFRETVAGPFRPSR